MAGAIDPAAVENMYARSVQERGDLKFKELDRKQEKRAIKLRELKEANASKLKRAIYWMFYN